MISTMTATAMPAGRHERNAGHGQPENRDDDGAAGEDDRLPGCGDGSPDRLLDGPVRAPGARGAG